MPKGGKEEETHTTSASMAPKRKERKQEETVTLGPQVREGEHVFGVVHIFASFNDTFVHVTEISGRETLVRVTGGMKVKADRDESSPYAAMLAAQDVAVRCKELGITALHVKLRATGGNKTKTPGPGAQSALRALARSGIKIGRIGTFSAEHNTTTQKNRIVGGPNPCLAAPVDAHTRGEGRRENGTRNETRNLMTDSRPFAHPCSLLVSLLRIQQRMSRQRQRTARVGSLEGAVAGCDRGVSGTGSYLSTKQTNPKHKPQKKLYYNRGRAAALAYLNLDVISRRGVRFLTCMRPDPPTIRASLKRGMRQGQERREKTGSERRPSMCALWLFVETYVSCFPREPSLCRGERGRRAMRQ